MISGHATTQLNQERRSIFQSGASSLVLMTSATLAAHFFAQEVAPTAEVLDCVITTDV